ncbi:MAG: hypothetical protein Tsb0020_49200 [Haliangiales bacterium]
MTEARIIKRYANRKLYDTQHSRYVTLDQISEMVRNGDDVQIIDNKTKEDLTSVTMAQIIFEEEKKQRSFLPLQTLRNIIQNGGESFANLVNEAQRRMTSILPRRKDGEEGELGEVAGDGVAAAEATPGVVIETSQAADAAKGGSAADDSAEAADGDAPRKNRDGVAALRELREWVQQSQRAIDDWHQRMDGRIRHVVEGISPFAGVQKDVQALSERIASLESKLQRLASMPEGGSELGAEPSSEASSQRANDDGAAEVAGLGAAGERGQDSGAEPARGADVGGDAHNASMREPSPVKAAVTSADHGPQ